MIVCLTPCRNCESDLPGLLQSARGFADAVIALDDGSTDRTADILATDPLVREVLHNPPRDSYAGWDDTNNRQRLLDAAIAAGADWVVFLDADERLAEGDGARLREFLEGPDALPGCAYGFELHRMWDERISPAATYVYRAFRPAEGQTLPERRLHFDPVPRQIPAGLRIATSIRVLHLDSPERLAARLAKYREADPDDEYRDGALIEDPGGAPDSWPTGLPDLSGQPVLAPDFLLSPADGDGGQGPTGGGGADGPVVCLLPVRNAAAHLPAWFDSVRPVADTVIALDDGSTDDTAALLEAEPLVSRVLRNPPRDSYAGWDDAANRQRLLDAAAACRPGWILWLDADERLDPDDARALRDFIDTGAAKPGYAYGMRVYRMVGDENHFDRADFWAYRLFAWQEGQRLPGRKLHLVPVPESIPRRRWLPTTIRIKHLAGIDDEHRRQRHRKYVEADPDREYQDSYENLLQTGGEVHEWVSRPPGLPVVAAGFGQAAPADLFNLPGRDDPLLSVVVISRNDRDVIRRALDSILAQELDFPHEVIVVVSGDDGTADIVRTEYPQVRLVDLGPGRCLPGRARNAGVAVARGEYVSFPGSHMEACPGSLAARVGAHEAGNALVTGVILNGTDTSAGWATYFLEHAGSLPGRPSGELAGPPVHCSYPRDFLEEIGGFPDQLRAGEDTAVNNLLYLRGHRAYFDNRIRFIHHSRCTTPGRLLRHHYHRGRSLARILRGQAGSPPAPVRVLLTEFTVVYPFRRVNTARRLVRRWGSPDEQRKFRKVRPLMFAASLAAWAGLWRQLLVPWPDRARGENRLAVDRHRDDRAEGLE